MSDEARDAQEHGWRELDEIEAAYRSGGLDTGGWHRAVLAIVEPAYLAAGTPQGGSGHSGSAGEWDRTRSIVMEAVSGPGSFMDIGCANGLLMESVHRWGAQAGLVIEPFGVDISDRLVELARARCPQWADRLWCENAARWHPSWRFDYVRTAIDYVPADRRAGYLRHLLDEVVAADGRLIVGKLNEIRGDRSAAAWAAECGFTVKGEVRRASSHQDVEHTVFWIDSA